MINPLYAGQGEIEDKLIEELAELIEIICKAKRFGLFNVCPEGGGKPKEVGKTNYELLIEEMADVEERLIEYKDRLMREWLKQEVKEDCSPYCKASNH